MKQDMSRQRRLGIAVLLILILGSVVVVSNRTFLGESLTLRAVFHGVPGLRVGADVQIAGFTVGHVASIEAQDRQLRGFKVTVRLDRKYDIPTDSLITLFQSNPLDVVRLAIQLGNADTLFVSGDLIPTGPPVPGLLDAMADLAPKANQVMDRFASFVDRANAGLDEIKVAVDRSRATIDSVTRMIAEADGMIADMHKDLLQSGISGKLDLLTDDAHQAAQTAEAAIRQFQDTGRQTAALVQVLSTLVRDNGGDFRHMVRDSEFVLRRLAGDIGVLLDNLREVSANLKEASQDLRNNPGSVIFGRQPHEQPGQSGSGQTGR